MANTRSGGGDDAPPSTPAAASATATRKLANGRETRSTTAAAASTQTPNLRRSTRENKGKHKSRQLPATPSSHRSAKTPTKDATAIATPKSTSSLNNPKDSTKRPTRVSRNTTPSPSKQDSIGTSTPTSTKRKTQDDAQAASTPSKKHKRLMQAKSYIALFSRRQEPELQVLAPLRENEEKASEVQPEGDGAVLVHEESNAPEQPNQEPSNVAASEVFRDHSSDAHETEVILEENGLKIGSHQSDVVSESCTLPEMCSLNKAVESIPMLETGEEATGEEATCDSNHNSLLELQNSTCSTIHHEEASKPVEHGDSIGIQGACTSRNIETIQCDETGYNDNICVGCRSREMSDILKSCGGKGCKRHYHLSCMDPPLDVSLGIWLCIMCIKKKLQFGVYSVSEGIESLWDVKEGAENSTKYFVKYKNLAHVHNQWVSEIDIVNSTPQGSDLISRFSKRIHKEKTIRWKQEWAEPHRLLKRRLLMPPKEAEVFFSSLGDKYCNVEWLVKWKDLGYEHATWELESSSFLCTPEAEELKRSYEDRFKAARKASDPSKLDKVKRGIFQQLQRLPDGCPPGLDDDHLRSLNQLREFWHNSRGAVFIDDQERVIKTVLFVTSILPHICRPLLIVSTTTSLSLWETKFNRLAASINVVVYNGEKDVRKSIRDLEFYEDGSVMLRVLLSHPDAILEDIEAIEQINWEAVLVDDCQNSRVLKCLEQLKRLPTNFRMVLLSSSLKESIAEHINLLSFLNPEENGTLSVSNGVSFDTAGTLAVLKAKLARYVAFERKADSSKLLEYWVPARLSPVQLEVYCYILLSNSPALRSHSKTDNVGALRNILISLRKCCDHPYLVDQSLQNTLTKDRPVTDILDIGVRSCGKLLLLDRILQQIRIQGLRVLILSQSGGGSGNPMGDILDDFVRQRFGYESYERVERGLLLQKKQTAMNMFNDKTKGRFIFLIDSRACGPSIKLSSVDAIIIYGSDWNPMNDLRALQRVSMESKSEPVPIFRLYSSCTVEEKALILAKHDHILDSNILNITPSLSHCLLSWGASFLFNRLEELQNPSYSNVSGDELFMDNVVLEFFTKLLNKVELSTESGNAAISQAYLRGSFYSRAIVVAGEKEGISSVDGDLPKFWAYWLSLLNGRSPHWQYISEPAQRSRRKIHNTEQQLKNTEEQLKIPTEETDEARIKRRRIGEIMDSSPKDSPGKNKDTILPENNTPCSSHGISVEDTWQELERNNLHGTQKSLHVQLKPELSKLYALLQLPENVKSLCEEFLEYILKNHQISQEPKGLLHAFNLALCWRAASLSKHKISHTESLMLAVNNLNYECKEELAEFVYAKLKILKKKFARRAGEVNKQNYMASVINISTCEPDTSVRLRNDELIPSQVTLTDSNFENGSHHEATGDFWTEEMVSGEKELPSDPVTHEGERLSRDELLSKIMDERIKLIDKVFSLRGRSIHDTHSNEISFLEMHRQKEVAKLKGACNLVVKHLRSSQNRIAQEERDGKIKLVIEWFTMLLYAFLEHMKCQRDRLDMQQSASMIKESQLKEETLQAAKCGRLDQNFDQHIPLPHFEFAMEEFRHFREVVGSCHVQAAALAPELLDDNSAMEITLVRSTNASEVIEKVLNRPAEVLVQGPASEVVYPSVNGICGYSDGISSQGDASLVLNRPAEVIVQGPASEVVDPSMNRSCNYSDGVNSHGDASLAVPSLEPSSDDLRSTDHVEENTAGSPVQGVTSEHLDDAAMEVETDHVEENTMEVETDHVEENTAGSPVQGGTSEHLGDSAMEVEAGNRADPPHFDTPALNAPSRQATLPVSQEIEMQSNLVDQCAQQSLVSSPPLQGEPGQADLSSAASAQRLQSERQRSIPLSNNLLERTQLDQTAPNYQADAAPSSAQSAELFPVTSMMFNHPPIDVEPLKNELHKLRLHMDTLNKIHEIKKTQLQTECSQEVEKVKRKYDLLLKEHNSTHLQQKKALDDFYEKVQRNQSLAEDFRAKFISTSAAQGAAKAHTPPVRHTPQATPQVMRPPVLDSSASSVALSSACRLPVPRPRVQVPQVDQPSSSLSQLPRSSLPSPPNLEQGNLFRATSMTLSHRPPPRGSYGVQSELAPRSPAPHLQFRLPRAHSMPPGNQQPLPATRVEAMPSRTQPAPSAGSSPSDIHVGPLAASAMSSLHALPSTSLPSSLHPSNCVPSTPNPTLQAVAPSVSNTTMSSIPTGMQPPDSGSLSLDAWLTANLGLTDDASTASAKNTASLGLSSDAPRAAPATNAASLGLSSDAPRAAPATNTASLGLSSDVPRGAAPATNTASVGLGSNVRGMVPARLSSDSPGLMVPATTDPKVDVVCLSDDE